MNRCWKRVWPSTQKQNKSEMTQNGNDGLLIKEIQDEDEWDKLIEQSKNDNLIFITYFTSQWCKPCKEIYPFFEELCKKSTSKMKFVKLDIDKMDDISLEYKVTVLPTFIKFQNGKQTETVKGPKKEELQ